MAPKKKPAKDGARAQDDDEVFASVLPTGRRGEAAEPMGPKVAVPAVVLTAVRLALVAVFAYNAYQIRLFAIKVYGLVIHEFDPWFNFRATQYLADNGWHEFFRWFDHMPWRPLGRPVGTTIYPGMQITTVTIWKVQNALFTGDWALSLNDVCCYVPAWFGVVASLALALLTNECTGSVDAGIASALVMSVVPAHIMRSVGGGYDNECIAVAALCMTFYFWCRSLRADDEGSWKWGVATGLAYTYMVAAWGGYIFVGNMIAVHAGVLVCVGRFSLKLHKAYSIFYVLGTMGAMQVPVVGTLPLTSLEQLGMCVAFLGLQVLAYCHYKKGDMRTVTAIRKVYIPTLMASGLALLALIMVLAPTGYFGPLSSRVRGLFVRHTRTGNPLVDSVAEHQPSSTAAYSQYLHNTMYVAPVGLLMLLYKPSDAIFSCWPTRSWPTTSPPR